MANQRFRNRGVVAQGMLAPSGLAQTIVNPQVQATTRPAGSLLKPSPGYDSIRVGKNRFQGKGPTGGFRRQEFAEDLGGSGAALSVVPGSTSLNDVTEWLPEGEDSMPAGSLIIADRHPKHGFATSLHEAFRTIPDMGDRHPERPLSKSRWLVNPIGMFRADYRESPAITVAATAGLILLATIVARDLERQFGRYRGRGNGGVIGTTAAVPAAAVATTSDVTQDSVKAVADTADKAVEKIEQATEAAVDAIKDTAESAKSTVTGD